MNSDELKAACVRAGARIIDNPNGTWEAEFEDLWRFDDNNPALPAYVAERLVEMVLQDPTTTRRYSAYMENNMGFISRGFFASTQQRIRACMAVLQ